MSKQAQFNKHRVAGLLVALYMVILEPVRYT